MEELRVSGNNAMKHEDSVGYVRKSNETLFLQNPSWENVWYLPKNNQFPLNGEFELSDNEDTDSIKLSESISNEPHVVLFRQYEHLISNEGNFVETKHHSGESLATNDKDIQNTLTPIFSEENSIFNSKGNKYWKRKDVVHKGILRMLKSFFP